jgi:hypothetical protein
MKKIKLRRKPGRPRVSRIKTSDELEKKDKRKCSEYNELGHTAKYCQGGSTASQRHMLSSTEQSNDPIHVDASK